MFIGTIWWRQCRLLSDYFGHLLFVIFSEWFIVHSSKISHTDDAGMTGIFVVSVSLSFVVHFSKRKFTFLELNAGLTSIQSFILYLTLKLLKITFRWLLMADCICFHWSLAASTLTLVLSFCLLIKSFLADCCWHLQTMAIRNKFYFYFISAVLIEILTLYVPVVQYLHRISETRIWMVNYIWLHACTKLVCLLLLLEMKSFIWSKYRLTVIVWAGF